MNNLNGNNGGQSTQGSPFTQGGQSTPGGFFNNGGQRGDQFPEAGSRMRSTEDQLKIAHGVFFNSLVILSVFNQAKYNVIFSLFVLSLLYHIVTKIYI